MSDEALDKRVLRRLVEVPETLSRNQNYHSFDNPAGRRLLRIAARLRSLIETLKSPAATARWRADGAEFLITIDDAASGVHRETRLDADAFEILRENEDARAALGDASSNWNVEVRTC